MMDENIYPQLGFELFNIQYLAKFSVVSGPSALIHCLFPDSCHPPDFPLHLHGQGYQASGQKQHQEVNLQRVQ